MIENILKELNIPEEILLEIVSFFKPEKVKKNEFFIRYNKRMDKIGILLSGILVSRFTDSRGKEIASKFYHTDGDKIVVDYLSFIKKTSSKEEIQAIEDSYLLTIGINDYQTIIKKYPYLNKLIREFAEDSYVKGLDRIRDFQLLNTSERVAKFIKTNEKVINSLQINDKASYLGMSRNVFTNCLKKI